MPIHFVLTAFTSINLGWASEVLQANVSRDHGFTAALLATWCVITLVRHMFGVQVGVDTRELDARIELATFGGELQQAVVVWFQPHPALRKLVDVPELLLCVPGISGSTCLGNFLQRAVLERARLTIPPAFDVRVLPMALRSAPLPRRLALYHALRRTRVCADVSPSPPY